MKIYTMLQPSTRYKDRLSLDFSMPRTDMTGIYERLPTLRSAPLRNIRRQVGRFAGIQFA